MKLVHPELDTVFDTDNRLYNTLVVEEQRFLSRLLADIQGQLQGLEGEAVLSIDDRPMPFSKHAALLDRFVPFELNQKPLLNQIAAALAKAASDPEHFESTASTLSALELWLDALAFGFPCDIVFPSISVAALIKAVSPEIRCETASIAEKVLDYMELVETFDRVRLFLTLNMRSFIPDEEMEPFVATVLSHGYHVIGIESTARPLLTHEHRVIVDADLCEFG